MQSWCGESAGAPSVLYKLIQINRKFVTNCTNVLQQMNRLANKYALDVILSTCCIHPRSKDHYIMEVWWMFSLAHMTWKWVSLPNCGEGATHEAHGFHVESSKLKSVPLGIVRPKGNCWAPKEPFPTIMRILSGRFKFFEKPFRNVCKWWFLNYQQRCN